MRRVPSPEREQLAEQFRTEYEKGASIRQIAAGAGRTYGLVHTLLQESGATLRTRGGNRRRTSPASKPS